MRFNEKIQLLAETFILKEELDPLTRKPTGVKIQGLAITPDKPTRNKVAYSRESLMATHKSLIGKPFLDSHQDTSIRGSPPFGHVTNAWMTEKGLFYEVDVDPAEQTFINKAKRGDISGVSIQVLVEDVEQREGFVKANVHEFLELSAVLIPGDGDTSMKIAEAFKSKEQSDDNKIDPLVKKAMDKEKKKYINGPSVDDAAKKKKNKKPEPKDMMSSDKPQPKSAGKPTAFMQKREEIVICPTCKENVVLKDNSKEIIMLNKNESYHEWVKCPKCKTEMKLKEAKVTDAVEEEDKPVKLKEVPKEAELDTKPLPIPDEQKPVKGVGEIDDETEPPMPENEPEMPVQAPDAQVEPVEQPIEEPVETPMGAGELPVEEPKPMAKYKLQVPHFGDKYYDVDEAVDEEDAEKKYYDLRKKGKMPRIIDIQTGECVMEALGETENPADGGKKAGDKYGPNPRPSGKDTPKPKAGTPDMPERTDYDYIKGPKEDEYSNDYEQKAVKFNPRNGCPVCGNKNLTRKSDYNFTCPNCKSTFSVEDNRNVDIETPDPKEKDKEVDKQSFKLYFECLECKYKNVGDRFPEQHDGLVFCPECQGISLKSIKEKNKIGGVKNGKNL